MVIGVIKKRKERGVQHTATIIRHISCFRVLLFSLPTNNRDRTPSNIDIIMDIWIKSPFCILVTGYSPIAAMNFTDR